MILNKNKQLFRFFVFYNNTIKEIMFYYIFNFLKERFWRSVLYCVTLKIFEWNFTKDFFLETIFNKLVIFLFELFKHPKDHIVIFLFLFLFNFLEQTYNFLIINNFFIVLLLSRENWKVWHKKKFVSFQVNLWGF